MHALSTTFDDSDLRSSGSSFPWAMGRKIAKKVVQMTYCEFATLPTAHAWHANSLYQTELESKVWQAYVSTKALNADVNQGNLERGLSEAVYLAKSAIFSDEISPKVSVDQYGEFIFSHKSEAGYVDIGVDGNGELSYHVRNDIDPGLSCYDDYGWENYEIPSKLVSSLDALAEKIRVIKRKS